MEKVTAKVKSVHSNTTSNDVRIFLMDVSPDVVAAVNIMFGSDSTWQQKFEARMALVTTAMLHGLKVAFWFDKKYIQVEQGATRSRPLPLWKSSILELNDLRYMSGLLIAYERRLMAVRGDR